MAVSRVLQAEFAELKWEYVRSTNVESIAYVPTFGRCWVRFLPKPGSKFTVYAYLGVTPAEWDGLRSAGSKGRYVDRVFKKGGKGYIQVM